MKALSNIRIGTKIGAGFGTVLLMLLIIGGVGFYNLFSVGNDFTDYRNLARQTNEYGRVQANLLSARMGVKDFLINGTKESIDTVDQRIEATKEVITGTRQLTDDEKEIAYIAEIEEDILVYDGAFDSAVKFQAVRNELVATLDDLGPQMERKLTEILNSAHGDGRHVTSYQTAQVLRDLLLARLYVTKFLLSNDDAAYERAMSEFSSFTPIGRGPRRPDFRRGPGRFGGRGLQDGAGLYGNRQERPRHDNRAQQGHQRDAGYDRPRGGQRHREQEAGDQGHSGRTRSAGAGGRDTG